MIKKVAVCGQKSIAINCTETLLKKDVEVSFVVPNSSDSGKDTWQPSFRKWASSKKLNVINSDPDSLLNACKEHNVDLLFSIYYDRIFKKNLIEMIPHGIINMHLAPLPRYRGVAPVTMAILCGEQEHGVTLHYVNEGIDTGDIIAQKHFSIKDMNANTAFSEAMNNCSALFNEEIELILKGKNKRTKQNNSEALYFHSGTIDWSESYIVKNNRLFFNKDTRTLFNWFRAFIFPPMQFPILDINGTSFDVLQAEPYYTHNKHEKPGTVIELNNTSNDDPHTVLISTHDSYIRLKLKKRKQHNHAP